MQQLKLKLKAIARPVLGPIARPILYRIRRFTGIRAEVDALARAWHNHVPALTNAAASVAALAREQARMKRDYDAAIAELRSAVEARRAPPAAVALAPADLDGIVAASESLRASLAAAGLAEVEIVVRGRRDGLPCELQVPPRAPAK